MTTNDITAGQRLSAPVRRGSQQCAGEQCQCASAYRHGTHNTPGDLSRAMELVRGFFPSAVVISEEESTP
jgi:hypothetical protein